MNAPLGLAGTDAVRVAVVGAGILGRRHARVLSEIAGVRLTGVADHSAERAAAAATPAGAPGFGSMDELLAAVDCDAVVVATPDHLHTDPVLAALAAGKHVLVEKPLATSPADARRMIDTAAAAGRVLQVNYSQRWVPEYAWMKEQIEAGAIGRPAMLISIKHDTIEVPTGMISWAASTSPIWFMSSHDIDLAAWYLDDQAESVVAHERRGVLEGLGIHVHDGVDALVRFAGGATASFHSSWVHPRSYPTLTAERMTIIGEAGVLEFQSRGRSVECYGTAGGRTITFAGPQTATEVDGRIEGAFRTSLMQFLTAIISGAEPTTAAARTLHVVDIQAAILAAARTGAPIRIGPAISA